MILFSICSWGAEEIPIITARRNTKGRSQWIEGRVYHGLSSSSLRRASSVRIRSCSAMEIAPSSPSRTSLMIDCFGLGGTDDEDPKFRVPGSASAASSSGPEESSVVMYRYRDDWVGGEREVMDTGGGREGIRKGQGKRKGKKETALMLKLQKHPKILLVQTSDHRIDDVHVPLVPKPWRKSSCLPCGVIAGCATESQLPRALGFLTPKYPAQNKARTVNPFFIF